MLRGALAAALTPLRDAGEALDETAIGPYVDFLADGGVDGLLALGTTGEGFLLPVEQRRRAAQLFVEAAAGRLQGARPRGAAARACRWPSTAGRSRRGRRSSSRRTPPTSARTPWP